MAEIKIDRETANQRLDRFLKKHLPFSTVQRLIRKRLIRVNEKRQAASYMLQVGDTVKYPESITLNNKSEHSLSRDQQNFLPDITLYEDESLLVINKPAGMPVQGGTGIKFSIDDAIKIYPNARLVHRLDRDTSGVLLIALNVEMARHLTKCFKENTAKKIYWALVEGRPKPMKGTIEASLHRPAGEKLVIVHSQGKRALSTYQTLEHTNGNSWLELSPHTGRTHQLRVHCQFMNCPIVGDKLYGSGNTALGRNLCLHARQIIVPGLDSDHALQFTAPLPKHMNALWQKFDWHH